MSSIPATYLIDPDGTIIRLDLRGKALDETLSRLIKTAVLGDSRVKPLIAAMSIISAIGASSH